MYEIKVLSIFYLSYSFPYLKVAIKPIVFFILTLNSIKLFKQIFTITDSL